RPASAVTTDQIAVAETGVAILLSTFNGEDRKSTRLNSSHRCISYAVFCFKKFDKGYPNEELMVRVTGRVVAQFQSMFLADHYFETGKVLDPEDLFPFFFF